MTSTLTFDLENSRFKVIIREGSGVQAGKIAFQRTHQNILGTSRWSRAGPSGEPSRFGLPSAMFLFLFYLFFCDLPIPIKGFPIPAPTAPRDRTSAIHLFFIFFAICLCPSQNSSTCLRSLIVRAAAFACHRITMESIWSTLWPL